MDPEKPFKSRGIIIQSEHVFFSRTEEEESSVTRDLVKNKGRKAYLGWERNLLLYD